MRKIFILLISCIVLVGFSFGFTKVDEDEVTVYTTQESEDVEFLVNEFQKEFPHIKLNMIKGTTGDITAKLLLEKENPQADVIWNVATSSLLVLDKYEGLAPYAPPGLEVINEAYYDTKNPIPTWVGTTIWAGVIAVNVEEAQKKGLPIPESYSDLVNPIYKGEVVMPDPIASGTGYMMVNTWLQTLGEEKGWEYIDGLSENMKYFTTSGSAPAKSTAIGEQVIGLSYDKSTLKLEKDVPQIKTIFPTDGMPFEIDACALTNKKEIKPEAKIFYDWAVSKETIEKLKSSRVLTTLKGDNSAEGIPENFDELLADSDLYWAADNKNRISLEWTKRYSGKK